MYSLVLLGIVSFLAALLLTPVCRNLFRSIGWLDRPDHDRHLHEHPVPRIGGIPIALAYLAAFLVLLASPLAAGEIVGAKLTAIAWIMPAVLLVFCVGLVDDLRALKPWQKLTGQAIAALAAYGLGVRVMSLAGYHLDPWLSVPLTVVWLVGCANAFNLIDGIDGLATGVGLFATLTMLLAALLNNNIELAMATVPVAGALLGFLRYNFNPASIFLGDSGSLTIGFLLGCYGVVWGQKSATVIGMTAPFMALAVPLLDTAIAIARRFLRQQPIFGADRGHIHHRLLDRGLTTRKAALILYAVCGVAAMLSLLHSVTPTRYGGLIVVLFCAVTWIGVQHLGYVEFGEVGRMFVEGAFRRHLSSHLTLRSFEGSLAKAQTMEDRWAVVREGCRQFGFAKVEMRLLGRTWLETLVETNGDATWSIRVPLVEGDFVDLTRPINGGTTPTVLGPFADTLHKHLSTVPRHFTTSAE